GKFGPMNLRHRWPSSRGNDNFACAKRPFANRDHQPIDKHGLTFDDCHPGALQQAFVDTIQAPDFGILVMAQGWPIERGRIAELPTEPSGLSERLLKPGRVDKQFLRDAADIDTGTTEIALFD